MENFGMVAQLTAIAARCAQPHRVQQQPPAHTAAGQVLAYLRAECAFKRQCEIREALQIRHPAAAWALLYLRQLGMVETVRDEKRNSRYMRYRAK